MRWIDVPVPSTGTCPETDRLLIEARTAAQSIADLQERRGLDTAAVLPEMDRVGRLLFQALTAYDHEAFHPGIDRGDAPATSCEPGSGNRGTGYHIVAPEQWTGLPWHWLHSGIAFLLESGPICAAEHGSQVPEIDPPRLWMQRHSDVLFSDRTGRESGIDGRPASPEILFVPGHCNEEIRRLIFREAEGIDSALQGSVPSAARLRIPGAVSPGMLAARVMLYQGLHFAAPTSQPPEISRAGENRWLAGLMAASGQSDPSSIDDLVGMEFEILGVDPIDAALDQAMASHTQQGAAISCAGASAASGSSNSGRTGVGRTNAAGWLLDDGQVFPEYLGRSGLPPLVFSNSWCSLEWLAQRFRRAGASTFVGTSVAIYSRPARMFAAVFYQNLASGLDAGRAHRRASLALRDRLGPEHPGWLAYGLQGYGCLRLRDL